MRRVLLGVVALAGVLAGPVASNVAAGGDHWRVVRLESTGAASVPSDVGSSTCDPAGNCTVTYTVTAQQTGGLTGTLTNRDTVWVQAQPADTFQFVILGLFSGTVQGCGSG